MMVIDVRPGESEEMAEARQAADTNRPRQRRIGGSDIPKLIGCSKYGGPLEVYRRIVEGVEMEWSAVMERGIAMEPQLRSYAAAVLGLHVEPRQSDYHQSEEYDFAAAQIDDVGRIGDAAVVVDYKTQNRFARGWGPSGTGRVPEHYEWQLRWEMMCARRARGVLIVGFGQDVPPPEIFALANVCHYQIEHDAQAEGYMLSVAKQFWEEHVLRRVPPLSGRKKDNKHE